VFKLQSIVVLSETLMEDNNISEEVVQIRKA